MSDDTDIASRLGNVEGKLDMLINLHTADSGRVRKIENKLYWVSGVCAAVSYVAAKIDFSKFIAIATSASAG